MKILFKISILFLFFFQGFDGLSQGNHPVPAKGGGGSGFESQLPEGKKWKLVWSDEFDGTSLDTTKWMYRLYFWQTRHETWTTEGAALDGKGNLVLKVYEKDGKFYSSTLQTGSMYLDRPGKSNGKHLPWPVGKIETPKFMHKYGYYEIRCLLPEKSDGWWPAFWIQSPCIGSTLNPGISGVEIDIMEYFKRDEQTRSAVLWNGYGPHGTGSCSCDKPRPGISKGYHTFGVDWTPTGDYIFYIDGKEHWRFNGPVSNIDEFILISTECAGYREGIFSPLLKKENLPDHFIVDYVRVFDEIK
jgi:beta-glucanase (GH16 family)